ncbi:PREDICTED: uncharacterized protein LOC109169445 [Ipomoea nil]|uniref:uncharacterized protein LOC109169445 n=1 Tax=Ipomoea nil TaxID=35883 RepID=UPI00090199C3|nr:PREDICTED: uncharacterized protein LOC109169445 [Ipomoea nil]
MPPQLAKAKEINLIDQVTGRWDHHLLTDIFLPNDVSRIMKIPISPDYDDMWYLHGDPKGCYSVKNGYRLIVGNYENNVNNGFTKWLTLWKLKIPPKWKTFLWRGISDILPTTYNFLIKRVEVDPLCVMCGITNEDTMHSLVLCGYAKSIWTLSNLPLPNIVTNIFHEWFSAILNVLDSDGIIYAAAILYHLWRARNGAVWDACLPLPKKVLAMAKATMRTWQQIHANAPSRTLTGRTTTDNVQQRTPEPQPPIGDAVTVQST